MTIFGREPALIAGLVNAVLALLITFGMHLTNEQVGAIMAVVNIALALLVRQNVTPTAAPVLTPGTTVNDGTSIVRPVGLADVSPPVHRRRG